jgi:DNA modification methylase
MKIQEIEIEKLIPYARNSRTHSDDQVAQIAASIKEFGWTNPILVDGEAGIIAGHGRLAAARKLGLKKIPVIELSHLSPTQKKALIIADNKLALNAGWDNEMLALEFEELELDGFDLALTGFGEDEINNLLQNEEEEKEGGNGGGNLAEKFLIPPFSTLNAREGWWQSRKKAWLNLGIKSEEGRDAPAGGSPDMLARQNGESGTSIFDPVLCEIAYRWFSPEKGIVLDPFAGGSVRGIVAAKLNRQYVGHELREEQVLANQNQGAEICIDDEFAPAWICGDSQLIDKTCADIEADFIFSCPPYADLEVYSDNPKDLSTMQYDDFKKAYFEIIKKSCDRLKNNRFACFVVGDVRNKKGNYYNFVGDTIEAFRKAGLEYYNEAILITPCGSVALRAGKTFATSRKLGKAHQNVLVFVKGDGKKAAEACGEIEIDDSMLEIVAAS